MTLPISCIEVAPVAEIASVDQRVDLGVGELFGGEGLQDLAFGPLLLGELGATGRLERLDRLGAPLDLLAGDLADLVVGELVHDLLLAVRDRGREHAERAQTDLVPGPQGRGHLLVHLCLQRGVAHVDSPPVLSRILLALASIAVVCIAYGVAIERRAYRLVRRGLAILPADGPESVTVLHLSDLHFVSTDRRKRAFLASIPRADVTVVTGDFLAEPEAVETAVEAVRETRGRLASWFVLGSNDYYVPHAMNPLRYFIPHPPAEASSGSARPVGRAARAPVRGRLAGPHQPARGARPRRAGDRAPGSRRRAHPSPGPAGCARRAPSRFGIAVMHSPDSAPEIAACGYPFVVAGHTHGGQVRLPLVGALVTNSHLPRRLVSGLIRMGGSFVHVSPGLGTSKFAPFRFLCRPEATLLELRRAPGGGGPAQLDAQPQ